MKKVVVGRLYQADNKICWHSNANLQTRNPHPSPLPKGEGTFEQTKNEHWRTGCE